MIEKAPQTTSANLIEILRNKAKTESQQVIFNFLLNESTELSITFGQLDHQARTIAAQLQEMQLTGERALLLYPPGLDYIAAFIGCLYAGVIAVPAYPPDLTRLERSMPRFLSIIGDAQPALALTNSPILNASTFLATQFPVLKNLHLIATDQIPIEASDTWKMPNISPETLAFLQYTSGSTAEPKGVMLTHANLMSNLETISVAFEIDNERDTGLFWLPFYHDMGLIGGILETLYCARTTTLLSPLDFLQHPLVWLQEISKRRIRISGGPNFAYDLCVRKATREVKETLDLSCWTLAFNGAEPVRADTLRRFSEAFRPCGFRPEAFYPCYGLAEATLLVTGASRRSAPIIHSFSASRLAEGQVTRLSGADRDAQWMVSCGRTWLDQQVYIVDPQTCLPLEKGPEGATPVGEVWVRGPGVAQGYWKRPEDTQRTFPISLAGLPPGRYLRSGDLGFLQDGELYIVGRIKDLIILDGLNHYPQDIELTVEKCHPAIRPGCSATFSVDLGGQERLVVVVELAKNNRLQAMEGRVDISHEAIRNAIRRSVSEAHDLRIHDIVLIQAGSLPKTSSGKVQRHACRLEYLNGSLERVAE